MAYEGEIAVIPFGSAGFMSDIPQTQIPQNFLIRATNTTFYNGYLEKTQGSRWYNTTPFPAGVKAFKDFWINPVTQRVITVCKNGKIYKLNSPSIQSEITASSGAPAVLNIANYVTLVQGGNEQTGTNKKIFVFTGNNPVQVVSGDATTRTNLSNPPTDWTGTNQPFAGIIYRNRLFAWGNQNDPHRIYASQGTNHENFTSNPLSFSVYPGEFDGIVGGFVFKGRLYVAKYPRGIYQFVDTDTDSANWYFAKFSDDIGCASPHSFAQVLDDLFLCSSNGGISSFKAAFVFGDLLSSDIFHQLRIRNYSDEDLRKFSREGRYIMYYPDKKQLYVAFQSNGGYRNDRLINLDYKYVDNSSPQNPPKVSVITKDQPNCLSTIQDVNRVERPCYGADDGYIYQLDQVNRWVGSVDTSGATGYTMEAETPHMNFSGANLALATKTKMFEFLELEYDPTGDWNVEVDVYIDGKFLRTLLFRLNGRTELDSSFVLNVSPSDGSIPFETRKAINAFGRKIGLVLRNKGLGENVRIQTARIYFRWSAEQQKGH